MIKTAKLSLLALALFSVTATSFNPAKAENITTGEITLGSVGSGLTSLIIWPGIGQAIQSQPGEKILTHAIIGFFPPFRFWSAYDALVHRRGGYWDGKI